MGRHFGGPGQGPGGGQREGDELRHLTRFWDDSELVEAIGLSEGQIDALEASFVETELALEAVEGSVRDAHEAIKDTIEVDSPDVGEVNAAIDSATAARNELMKILLGHRVVVKNVLTAEQEDALREYRRDHLRERIAGVREHMEGFRGVIRGLLEDGSLSAEDWETINALLENLDPEVADRIRERIEAIEQGDVPPASQPPALRSDNPDRGVRGEGRKARGSR